MVGMYPEASERNHRPVRLLSTHRRSFEIYLHLFYRTDQFRKLALVWRAAAFCLFTRKGLKLLALSASSIVWEISP